MNRVSACTLFARPSQFNRAVFARGSFLVWLGVMCLAVMCLWPTAARAQSPTPPRINVPYLSSAEPGRGAIFWFGKVDNDTNYADVRTVYNNDSLVVSVQIFDRRLWYDSTPTPAEMSQYDATSLYLRPSGSNRSYRFVIQLRQYQTTTNFQTAYVNDGAGWTSAAIPFSVSTVWRGDAPNNSGDDRGWMAIFRIPFSSFGLTGQPAQGTIWQAGLAVHDRDDSGIIRPDRFWPATFQATTPLTWSSFVFGTPVYVRPAIIGGGLATVRQGLNGATVTDAAVGGGSSCGDPYGPNYFSGWGNANYAGDTQLNIQHQADVADWPCFSKYYVTFPLGAIPSGKAIISATLTLYLFGNAGYQPGQAQSSLMQAAVVADAWDEAAITWNTAPGLQENMATTTVLPVTSFPGWPGVPYRWDLSRAVALAYTAGRPLRLVLYSSDNAYHSGKYFSTSEVGNWNQVARPTLQVQWGEVGRQGTAVLEEYLEVEEPNPTPPDAMPVHIFLPAMAR